MNKFLLMTLFFVTLFITRSYAQNSDCTSNVDTTNTYTEAVNNGFNWEDITDFYNVNVVLQNQSDSILNLIRSPFNSDEDPNVQNFYNQFNDDNIFPDCLHSDGWDLIQYQFGTLAQGGAFKQYQMAPSGSIPAPLNGAPYFILYNKYTGLLRVFVLILNNSLSDQNITGMRISLSFRGSSNPLLSPQSAVLSTGDTVMNAVDNFTRDQQLIVPNAYETGHDYTWLRADYTMTYDPCTCMNPDPTNPPYLYIDIEAILEADLEAYTVISGTIIGEDTIASSSGVDENGSQVIMSGLSGLAAFSTNYDNTNKLFEAVNGKTEGTAQAGKKVLTTPSGLAPPPANFDLSVPEVKTLGLTSPEATVPAATAPAAGAAVEESAAIIQPEVAIAIGAIGFLNYLMASSSKSSAVATQTGSFIGSVNLNATTLGTVTTNSEGTNFEVILPGSNNSNNNPTNPNNDHSPYYKNPMGVFSVLTPPVVEYVKYTPSSTNNYEHNYDNHNDCSVVDALAATCLRRDDHISITLPNLREYRLRDDIQWAINPAADVDLVGIKAALVFSYNGIVDSTYHIIPHQVVNIPNMVDNVDPSTYSYPNPGAGIVGYNYNVDFVSTGKTFTGPVLMQLPPIQNSLDLYPNELEASNLELEINPQTNYLKDYVFRTRYTNLGCLTSNSVQFFDTYNDTIPNIYLKLVITVRRKNATPSDVDIVFVQSYKVNVVNSNITGKTWDVEIGSHPPITVPTAPIPNDISIEYINDLNWLNVNSIDSVWAPNPFTGIPDTATFPSTVIPFVFRATENFQAFQKITIVDNNIVIEESNITATFTADTIVLNNVNIDFGNTTGSKVEFVARDLIITNGGGQVTGTGDIIKQSGGTLYAQTPTESVCDRAVPPMTDFSSFCAVNGTYGQHAWAEARMDASTKSTPVITRNVVNTSKLTVTPNPVTESTNVYYTINNNDNVTLNITDILGKPITNLVDSFQNKGSYQVAFPLNNIADGVYLCTLHTSEGFITQRVVVVR